MYLTNKLGAAEFSEEDCSLVETFALHAGIAMENARLHEQLQRLAVVDERERISKDLHDGIIQNLYGVGLSLEDISEFMVADPAEAAARVERAIDAIHLSSRTSEISFSACGRSCWRVHRLSSGWLRWPTNTATI